jgi:cell division protein FtsW (lipid II flippase)
MNPLGLFAFRTPWLVVLVLCVGGIVLLARAGDARPELVRSKGRRLERITLALALVPLLTGLLLAYMAASREFEGAQDDISSGRLLNLSQAQSEARLETVFRFIAPDTERHFIAGRIQRWLTEPGHSAPQNVGALSRLSVSDDVVEQTPGLPGLAKRLEEASRDGRGPRQISVLSASQIRIAKPALIVRTPGQFRRDFLLWTGLTVLCFVLVHVVWTQSKFRGDQLLLAPLALLTGIGLMLMSGLRDPLRDTEIFVPFAQGVAAGSGGLLAASVVDFQRRFARLTYVPLVLSLGLSVALLVFGSGPGASAAKVNLGPVQPVEAMRLCLILFMAGYFGKRWQFLRDLREVRPRFTSVNKLVALPKLDHLAPVAACVVVTLAFFFLQKDLGPALLVACLFLGLYAIARGRGVLAGSAVAIVILGMALGSSVGFPRTVADRVQMFVSPWNNVARGGDQLASALWALSSGGALGSGIGLGDAAQVPAAHTDMVLAVVGEELGLVGVIVVFVCWGLLLHRGRRIALASGSAYAFFLVSACAMATAFQILLIAGGVLGVAPLSGVVSPFLSYGRSSMIANCLLLGVLASVSAGRSSPSDVAVRFSAGVRALSHVVVVLLAALLGRAFFIQKWKADEIASTGVAVAQQDGVRRLRYNPRLLAVADELGRGSVVDRNGLPLATSHENEVARHEQDFRRLGVLAEIGTKSASRFYPLEGRTFHLLGDIRTYRNWVATNTAYIEREFESQLRGFDLSHVPDTQAAGSQPSLPGYHDYRSLVPLLRHRYDPRATVVTNILGRDRRLQLTIDAPLMVRVIDMLRRRLATISPHRGAIVVIDVESGGVLATVSLPEPSPPPSQAADDPEGEVFDRARFGLYPPGSVFKLVTALAAIRADSSTVNRVYVCQRLADGRVGATVRGGTVRDDVTDTHPHGAITMTAALAQSCNAYFARLAVDVGGETLAETAKQFGIRVAAPNTATQLDRLLPQAGYGQGEVVVSPLQIATVAATIARECRIPSIHLVKQATAPASEPLPLVDTASCRVLADAMRAAVTDGTGRAAMTATSPIAGKTGTAELQGARSHAWFAGFAPYGEFVKPRIAFAVFVENGGYGGSIAAQIAAELVSIAEGLGLLR